MTGYPYIHDLFTAILNESTAIKGRFYMGNRYGLQEINYDQLGELIDAIPQTNKYPLAMLAPPHSYARMSGRTTGWEEYRIIMYFMKQTWKDEINNRTKTSMHSVPDDWHDMKRCAVNFMKVLIEKQRTAFPSYFQLPPNQVLYAPVSHIGIDRASGIRVDFDFKLFMGCTLEDYSEYPTINIPLDSHPEHAM